MSDPGLAHQTESAANPPVSGQSLLSNRRREHRRYVTRVGLSASCATLAGFAAARPGPAVPHAARPLAGSELGWSLAGLLVGAGRVIGYIGATLLIGTLTFWLLVWPSGRDDRKLVATLWIGLLFIAASAPVGVAGTLAAAVGVGVDPWTMLDRPLAPFLARMAICAALAAYLARNVPLRGTSSARERTGRGTGAVMALSLVLTIVAARPGPLSFPTAVLTELHILAAAGWAGGLAALAIAMIPRRDPTVLNATLGSFSWLSMACVATLAVTGTIHALLHAGGLSALISSPYGAALATKLLAVAGMLLAAAGSHAYVRRLRVTPAPVQVVALFIGAELALGVAAMMLTAALVAVAA